MNRFFTKSIALVALVGAFTLVPAAKSEAAFDAWICNDFSCLGGGDVHVEDNMAGDTVGLAGVISFNALGIGGMDITFNTSFSHPQVAQPQLDLAFSTTSSGAGDVWIWTANDYTVLTGLTARIGGTLANGATVQGVGSIIPSALTNYFSPVFNSSPYAGSWSIGPALASPYRMWLGVHVVHTQAGVSSGDAHIVPEPMTLSLLGLGLAGLAARRRRSA